MPATGSGDGVMAYEALNEAPSVRRARHGPRKLNAEVSARSLEKRCGEPAAPPLRMHEHFVVRRMVVGERFRRPRIVGVDERVELAAEAIWQDVDGDARSALGNSLEDAHESSRRLLVKLGDYASRRQLVDIFGFNYVLRAHVYVFSLTTCAACASRPRKVELP